MSASESVNVSNPLRRDLPPAIVPQSCTLVLFGATGDLNRRKLIPALYNLACDGFLPPRFMVVGVARRPFTDDEFRRDMLDAVNEHSRRKPVLPEVWRDFAKGLFYHQVRFDEPADYGALRDRLVQLGGRAADGRESAVLPGDRSGVLRHRLPRHLGAAGLVRRTHGTAAVASHRRPAGDREAVRARSDQRPRAERPASRGLRRVADLPHRPLPRQGDGAEHPGPAVRQRDLRADLEPPLRGSRADHRGRARGHGRPPRAVLRHRRGQPATWCRTT